MDIYLLKFTACLFVLWLIYYALLERQNNHIFKRFYLLGSIALSVIIPLLTITQYVEPAAGTNEIITTMIPFESIPMEVPVETQEPFNWPLLLWTLYGLGATLFGFRFIGNLIKLYTTITKHEKLSIGSFIYVLLDHYRTPHSFFRYIFLNKDKYNTNNIPKEVLIHEETHAKQWHSADILLIELVQILFWFHPLIYLLKHHIKLNHEFLADEAVLNNGVSTKTYQRILLQFSSSTSNHNLASTINYSSIKKRFTVMKTQTSTTRMWLSSLLLLPIIAILFYSFAEKEFVEKEKSKKVPNESVIFEQDSRLQNYNSVTTKYSEAIQQFLKGSRIDNSALKTLKTQADALYNSFTKEELSKHNILPPPPVPAQKRQNLPTQKEIEQYNAWAKKYNKQIAKANKDKSNEYPIVKLKDYKRFKAIYDSMTAEQRENAESFPEKFATLPPKAPKPPKPHLELKPKRNGKNVSPPPAPPAPAVPKSIDKTENHQNKNTIQPVEITIKQDRSLVLNGKSVSLENLIPQVKELNNHLSAAERMEYVMASIIVEKNKDKDFALKIQQRLREADIYNSSMGYNETKIEAGLPPKHFSMNAGLTLEQARQKREQMLKTTISDEDFDRTIDSLNKKNNTKWSYKVETEYVENIENENGVLNYKGRKYTYIKNDNNQEYAFYDSYGLIVDKRKIKALAAQLNQTKKPLKIKKDTSGDNSNISGPKAMSFTFSSLKNAKKIDWDLKKAFKDNFQNLKKEDSIRVVLEIDDKIIVDNKIIKDYKSEFIGTFGEIDIMYEKIKNHIKELKRK